MSGLADPGLPGLATALDPDSVLELLRRELKEGGEDLDLTGARIVEVRYKPGVSCKLLYQVKLRSPVNRRTVQQFVAAEVLRVDEGRAPPPPELLARYRASPERVIRTPTLYLPGPRMLVSTFPMDPALPWLMDAIDPVAVKGHLDRAWDRRNVRVRNVSIRVLGYTPRERATLRYDVLCEARDTGLPEVRRLIAKMHATKPPSLLFAGAWALWRAARGRARLAPPVGYVAPLRLTLQELVDGERLNELVTSPSVLKLVRKTAWSIAALHGLSLPLTRPRGPRDEAHVVHRWADVLVAIRPELGPRVERLRHGLVAELQARYRLTGPMHGDLHPANLISDGDHVTLIDLDEIAYGDTLLDVGRFLASLPVSALRVRGDVRGLAEMGAAFLDKYLALAPEDERRVRLFEAASLLTSAATPFRLQRDGWEHATDLLVEEAERVFRAASRGVPSAAGAVHEPAMPFEERMRWAADGVFMQAVLDPPVRETYGADLTACRPDTAGRAADGCRIRYDLSGWRHGDAWGLAVAGIIRAEGSGRTLWQRLTALWRAAQADPRTLLLPRPVAHLPMLSMLVVEPPSGVRLASLIGTPSGPQAAAELAEALAALHRVPMEPDGARSLDDQLAALGRRLERLSGTRPDLRSHALALLADVESACRAVPPRTAPVLRALHPDRVFCQDGRIAVDEVDKLAVSEPLTDAGTFLARLTLSGVASGNVAEVAELADRFREAYSEAAEARVDQVAAFEAEALLHLACLEAEQDSGRGVVETLLACAASRLTTC